MNIKQLNTDMRNSCHAKGIKGRDITFYVPDSGAALVGPLAGVVTGGNFKATMPTDPHGTMVTSIINLWCPESKIIVYDTGRDGAIVNESFEDIIKRIKADTKNRGIVCLSFHTGGSQYTDRMHELIQQLIALNVPVFAAAGNDCKEALGLYPATWQEPICIAAVDADGIPAPFSNWTGEMDFADDGVDVDVLDISGAKVKASGTSFATPTAAAKAGLILCQNQNMTEPELFSALKAAALDMYTTGFDPNTGWGIVRIVPGQAAGVPAANETPPKEEPMSKPKISKMLAYYAPHAVVTDGKTSDPPPSHQFGYVMGGDGRVATDAYIKSRAKSSYPDHWEPYYNAYKKWMGHVVIDCNAVAEAFYKSVTGLNIDTKARSNYANWCSPKSPTAPDKLLAGLPQMPGVALFSGTSSTSITHVGFLFEKYGPGPLDWYVLEARGKDYGLVITKLTAREWRWWGVMSKYFDYEETKEESTVAKVIIKNLEVDEDVRLLQTALNALGYDCGTADGKPGDKTMAGITAFCAAHSAATEGVTLPDAITLAVEIGGKKYGLEVKAV